MNVVTRGGTNTFRATAYEYYATTRSNANSFFRKQSADPGDRATARRRSTTTTSATRSAGPLRKDKLFFFWSQEWRYIERAPTDLVATVPDPAWLTDPASPNYVAPALRDPNAVGCSRRGRRPTPAPTSTAARPPTPRARARRSCASTGTSARVGA